MKKKVGILTAPDLAKKLADKYYETLPSLLSSQFDSSIEWEVEVIKDSITGAAKNFIDLYTNTESYAKENNWSYVINLTDLPILDEKKVIAADINKKSKTILLSVSAFGWGSIRKRVERAILYAMKEVYYLSNDNNQQGNEYNNKYYSQNAFPSKRLQRKTVYIEDTDSYHIRYLIFPSFIGKLQLVSGMVSVNKPLNMMKTLTSSLALSFTTGAFGLIFTTLWQLSYIFSELRLLSLSFASIFAILIWIILAHQLWDIPAGKGEKHISKLYNFTTLITLFISVSIYYITLFILFLITCLTILPADFIGKTIGTSGPADFIQYIEIAWLAASIATVAGAVGVGLTNEKLVKESTFSYRQQSRYENIVNKKSEK
ncbi:MULTISPECIES: 5,10-methylene-tetrahydrofolate dehydrogenase [Staphylococcus]|uniref:5,10-methylene-tetrahydrofolate dehydrogenase n=2 Tax=Staphylococcus TaxID=1279 RepID=UPI002E191287|nr:5,10-methylene-tetrahydrofolate dehydrogenase [Staphylococcus shinii]